MQSLWNALQTEITSCHDCPRLIEHCGHIAQVKRKAYLNQTYWGKPISGFGDPEAKLVIVGLAPAAHGANRTGRIFTGDRSGEWLYRALHRAGFANQAHSIDRQDGLTLSNVYITCIVKCAPPENKPSLNEQKNCSRFLKQEIQLLPNIQVWLALGEISFNRVWKLLEPEKARPRFKHGSEIPLSNGQWLLLSYHPSQQNTFTGRLTEAMLDSIFQTVIYHLQA